MGTLAYCLHKYKLDSGQKERLRADVEKYAKQGFNKHESELQASDDMVDMFDLQHESVVAQTEAMVRERIKAFESDPAQWFNWPFVQRNVKILENKIREYHNALYDTKTFVDSRFYNYDQPVPKSGGIIAAMDTKTYQSDKAYRKWVNGKIKQINSDILNANRSRVILLGRPQTLDTGMSDFRIAPIPPAAPAADVTMPTPFYKEGSEALSKNVEGEYGTNATRIWTMEAQQLYGESSLGDIGIREAVQNSVDAVAEAIERGDMKRGKIEVNTHRYADENAENPHPDKYDYSQGFEVIDNGIGFPDDVAIKENFMRIGATGKAKLGRLGRFGVAKAVILKPMDGTAWFLETNNNYYNSEMADRRAKVADLPKKRKGTKIWVRAPKNITSKKAVQYLETTELPKKIKLFFNGERLTDPFARRKKQYFSEEIYKDKVFSDDDGNTIDGKVTYHMTYVPNPPKEYKHRRIIRLYDPKNGIKLTQGINYISDQFPGALIIDIETNATPEQSWYPLLKNRQGVQYGEAMQPISQVEALFTVEGIDHIVEADPNWYGLADRGEWKNTIDRIQGDPYADDPAPHAGYKKFYQDLQKVLKANVDNGNLEPENFADEGAGKVLTNLGHMTIKIDKGYKEYRGGTMLHARLLRGYEAAARIIAKAVHAPVGQFYPMLSKTEAETGGYILAEYTKGSGRLGFNFAKIDRTSLKTPLALGMYFYSSCCHELAHQYVSPHNKEFSQRREWNERNAYHVFPEFVKIGELVLGKTDNELLKLVTKEVPVDRIVEKTKVVEKIITQRVEVPVTQIVEQDVPRMLAKTQAALQFPEAERNTKDDDKLYRPTRPEEGKRQLGLFGRTMAGIDARRVKPVDAKRPWGGSEQPITQRIAQGQPGGVQPGAGIKGIDPADAFFHGIPMGSLAQKIIEGEQAMNAVPASKFKSGELLGLARLFGVDTNLIGVRPSDIKKVLHKRIIEYNNVMDMLSVYNIPDGIETLSNARTMDSLRKLSDALGVPKKGTKVKLATNLMKRYAKTIMRTTAEMESFYLETKRPLPKTQEGGQQRIREMNINLFGKDDASIILDAIAGINTKFEAGGFVSYSTIMEDVPSITGLDKDKIKRFLGWAIRKKRLIAREAPNAKSLSDVEQAELFKHNGKYYYAFSLTSAPMIDPKEMAAKLDSPSMINVLAQKLQGMPAIEDVAIQLGFMAIEAPTVKKALRIASEKLAGRINDTIVEGDKNKQLYLVGPQMVLDVAQWVVAAHEGKNNSYTAAVKEFKKHPELHRDQGLLKDLFFGDPVARETGHISQYMATKAVKVAHQKHFDRAMGITIEDVKRLFKSELVRQRRDGSVVVTTRGGHELVIKSLDSIDTDNASFFIAYGRKPAEGELPTGRYRDGKIELHKDLSNNWALTHETMHWMEDVGIITSKEVDVLRNHIQSLYDKKKWTPANVNDIGGAEDRANYISLKMAIRNRKAEFVGAEGFINRMIQRLQDLLDGFAGMFRLTPQSLVRDIARGTVFERSSAKAAEISLADLVAGSFRGAPQAIGKFKTSEEVERYNVVSPQEEAFVAMHGAKKEAAEVSRELTSGAMTSWQKVGQWMRTRREIGIGHPEDTTFLERLLFTPLHYFGKVPALKAVAEDGINRSDNYYKLLHGIERNRRGHSRIQILDKFRRSDKKEYARLQKRLDENDMNKVGYQVKRKAAPEESAEVVFEIINPEGEVVATANDFDDGWRVAIQSEMNDFRKRGYSEQAIEALKSVRMINHNGFNTLIGSMRDLILQYAKSGQDLPKVATWVDGQRVEVDIKVAIAQMGDMRGYYMPRIRRPGSFTLYAKKKGTHPILQNYETKEFAAEYAARLKRQGYTTSIEPINKMPEDVFQLAGEVVAFQTMMNEALNSVSRGMKKGESAEAMKTLKKAQLEIGKALAEGVGNVFKGRGVRSHMIMRNDATGENVWKGYEEDITQRMAKYARSLAAGEAKKKMAYDMLRHFTGTDISWEAYKLKMASGGLKATYEDYLIMVKGRRVDPTLQKNAFHDGLTYMQDMLRNDEAIDRFIGMIKGVAVGKYLAGRVAAPLVNLTALATSVPASFSGFANIPMRKVPGLLADGMKGWRRYRQFLKGKDKIEAWERDLYEAIEDKGWHQAQYNKEALSVLKSKIGNQYDNTIELLMMGFGATEMLNRVATISGAYKGLRQKNIKEWNAATETEQKVLREKWLEIAKEVSDKAHGVYAKANRPHYARGANMAARLAQTFYVFKTFSHNYLQTMYDLGFKTKDRKALLYMALSPALIGGAASSPLIMLMFQAFGLVPGAPDEPEEAFYEFLEDNMGEGVEQLARLGIFGAGGYGVSLKGSLEIGVTDVPTSLKDLTGAPGSMLVDIWKGGKSVARGDYLKAMEAFSPNFIGSMFKAYREKTQGLTTGTNAPIFYGRTQVKLDFFEAMMRGLSFNPARIARIREKQWKERKVEMNVADKQRSVYAQIKAFYLEPPEKRTKEKWLKIVEEIQVYNEHVTKSTMVLPYITSKSIKNNLRRAFRPNKKERNR